ncbi:MAG: Na+/H+ antiporter subunit D, partial [Planctomycetota bacterium]|nr:Na+/H+ antiporter subunit D [Planctomycetota bacterium]
MLPADLIILLVAIPLAAGILSTLFRDWVEAQRLIGVVALVSCLGLAIHWMVFAASGDFIVTQVGGWPAPYGISVVFDALAGVLIIAANAVALACYLHAFGSLKPGHEKGWFHPLFMFLMLGVNFSLITGDLF